MRGEKECQKFFPNRYQAGRTAVQKTIQKPKHISPPSPVASPQPIGQPRAGKI